MSFNIQTHSGVEEYRLFINYVHYFLYNEKSEGMIIKVKNSKKNKTRNMIITPIIFCIVFFPFLHFTSYISVIPIRLLLVRASLVIIPILIALLLHHLVI